MNSARSSTSEVFDETELRKKLELAEEELNFLKSVFDEYKLSSAELETELDAQLTELESSNNSLRRENEQIRKQLQFQVSLSKDGAEKAALLSLQLEGSLKEMQAKEVRNTAKIGELEKLVERLQTESQESRSALEKAHANANSTVPSALLDKANNEVKALKEERDKNEKKVREVRSALFDTKNKLSSLVSLTESRFATAAVTHSVDTTSTTTNDLEAIVGDIKSLEEMISKTTQLMTDTGMSKSLIQEVSKLLNNPVAAQKTKLDGESEHAINASCLTILGKIMVLGGSLPEFKRSVTNLNNALLSFEGSQYKEEKSAHRLAHEVLTLAHEIMVKVFDPMSSKEEMEKQLAKVKSDAETQIDQARAEGERIARLEAEERLRREKAEADERLQREKADAEKKLAEIKKAQNSTEESLEEARKAMEKMKQDSEVQLQSARSEARAEAERVRREALAEAASEKNKIREEVQQLAAKEMDSLRNTLEETKSKYEREARKLEMFQSSMKHAVADQSKVMLQAMKNARTELETLKRSTQQELAATQTVLNDNLNHVRKVARTIAKTDIAQLSMMYERELEQRIKLQDQVQSLKGNIRVFCRVRPLLGKELENGEMTAVTQSDEMNLVCEDPEDLGKKQNFTFDRVFGPTDTQEVVFDEVRTLCLSALDGYNVCLFAYGITGSGKTFTVEGGEGARDNPKLHGLVYRTIKEIFRIAFGERAGAYETNIQVQLLELYNEDFRDLLNSEKNPPKLEVRIIPELGCIVEPVKRIKVNKVSEALAVVKQGYLARTVASTDSNELSSRSHSILTLLMEGKNIKTGKVFNGKLHFVDLAGSERVSKSGVTGQAFEEAKAINKSLSALGDVIQALSQKEKFIPYRNSPLTKLLQESLGGNSKTVMFVNIAPCQSSLSETVSSLRFATRAHKVEMGKAVKNEVENHGAEVKNIKDKMANLDAKFQSRAATASATVSTTKGRTTSTTSSSATPSTMKPPGGMTPRTKSGDKVSQTNLLKEKSPRGK